MTISAVLASAVFPPSYPTAYLLCIAYGHSWRLWRWAEGVRGPDRVWHRAWTRAALWCPRDQVERLDIRDEHDGLVTRHYTQPWDRQLEGFNLGHLRPEARAELARRGVLLAADAPDRDPAGWGGYDL
jgi:hypothetical protein